MTRWLDGVAILAWNLLAWVVWGAAVVQVFRTPTRQFVHGWPTKASRLVAISVLSIAIAGLFLPFGGAAVLIGLRRTARQANPLSSPRRGDRMRPTEPSRSNGWKEPMSSQRRAAAGHDIVDQT